MPQILVRVTFYKGWVIIDGPDSDTLDPDWLPAGHGRIGCLVTNTSSRLGVSPEALTALKRVKRGRDDIGDVMWFKADTDYHTFGWLGGPKKILNPDTAEGDSTYKVGPHIAIPNKPPAEAVAMIDSKETAS